MDTQILELLFQNIDEDSVFSIIYYGNRPGRDIDLLVISRITASYHRKYIDGLDVGFISLSAFFPLIQHWDPLVTDPVLTGETIYGQDILPVARELLSYPTRKEAIISHLHSNASFILDSAQYFWDQDRSICLNNIVFVLSYRAYADHYQTQGKPITFKELLRNNTDSTLSEAYRLLKKQDFDAGKIRDLLILCETSLQQIPRGTESSSASITPS